jgi:hypothetical protein
MNNEYREATHAKFFDGSNDLVLTLFSDGVPDSIAIPFIICSASKGLAELVFILNVVSASLLACDISFSLEIASLCT